MSPDTARLLSLLRYCLRRPTRITLDQHLYSLVSSLPQVKRLSVEELANLLVNIGPHSKAQLRRLPLQMNAGSNSP